MYEFTSFTIRSQHQQQHRPRRAEVRSYRGCRHYQMGHDIIPQFRNNHRSRPSITHLRHKCFFCWQDVGLAEMGSVRQRPSRARFGHQVQFQSCLFVSSNQKKSLVRARHETAVILLRPGHPTQVCFARDTWWATGSTAFTTLSSETNSPRICSGETTAAVYVHCGGEKGMMCPIGARLFAPRRTVHGEQRLPAPTGSRQKPEKSHIIFQCRMSSSKTPVRT